MKLIINIAGTSVMEVNNFIELVKQYPLIFGPVIVGFIAFCGVCVTAFATLNISKRSVYISSVTAQRAAWVERLRSNLAKFMAKSHTVSSISQNGNIDDKYIEELNEITSIINLQLNPSKSNSIDYAVSVHMDYFIDNYKDKNLVLKEIDCFTRHCQFLLKEEWEVIKGESKFDFISKALFFFKKRSRAKDYRKFREEKLGHLNLN